MARTFEYAPTLKYSPNDSDRYSGIEYGLTRNVSILLFDNSARLELYLQEYEAFVDAGFAVQSLYDKTA